MALDPVIFMQIEMANLYMQKHNLSSDEFLKLDDKYNILTFIEEGYEPFHLTGDEGILDEIQDYIAAQDKKQNSMHSC